MIRSRTLRTLPSSTVRSLVKVALEEMDTARSLSIWLIMNHTDLNGSTDDEILNLKSDPCSFLSSEDYFQFSAPTDLVRKSTILKLSSDPLKVATDRFHEAEELCRRTNRRLQLSRDPEGRIGEIIHSMRKNIRYLLPTIDESFLDRFIDRGGWGSGSTSSTKGSWVSFYHKLKAEQHATPALLPIARKLLQETRGWGEVSSLPYNTVAFVPKDAKTHRAIAVEPSINSFLQRAVGVSIRSRLKRWGINLHSQEKNRRLAHEGSLSGSFATIDLSMASDTIAYKVIDYLFPSEWSVLLKLLRSPAYRLGDSVHSYEKFSSMGNGYTFEVETLVFSAICKAICLPDEEWSVYGDDIIVPTHRVPDLAKVLDHLGFLVNEKKSFSSGPFRESCGADFFLGQNVRGFFLKEIKPDTPFVWANWLRQQSSFRFERTWKAIVRALGRDATFVPAGDHGLLGFHVDPSDSMATGWILASRPYGPVVGIRIEGWSFTPAKLDLRKELDLAVVMAHARRPVAGASTDLLEFSITARELGRWRRRRSVFSEDLTWLRGSF